MIDEGSAATYLARTPFDPAEPYYSVEVDDEGVTVYSECCGETMTRETAIKVRDAITAWLAEDLT